MKKLYIIGAGGFGREVAWLVERINEKAPTWDLQGFIDDNESIHGNVEDDYKVLGGCDYLGKQQGDIQKAEELLKIYSEAHLVLTGRLHGALPSLAMGTPVVLLEGKFGDERFEGLKYFVNSCTIKDLYSGKYPLDIEHPRSNPNEYIVLRNNLRKIARAFVNEELDMIDFEQINKENMAALSKARKRTIQFNKKHNLESIVVREFKSKVRFNIRSIQNLRKE